jgi:hypothetical protein
VRRALTDFGADESFAAAAVKVRAHYGVQVNPERVWQVSVAEAGACWSRTVRAAGWGVNPRIHAVGDCAPWIEQQAASHLGSRVRYLLDLYHICDQLDCPAALCDGLPVGSGLIESAHRHLLQSRLKRAGAWRTPPHARAMAQLRVCRANGLWLSCWLS